MVVYGRASSVINFKLTRENDILMTCHLRDTNECMSFHTLCTSILKYGF